MNNIHANSGTFNEKSHIKVKLKLDQMKKNEEILIELVKSQVKSTSSSEDGRPDKKKPVKYGLWSVDIHGNMDYEDGRYFIEYDRLKEDDWIIHIWGRECANWNDFIPAYFQACYNAGIQKITQLVKYAE